MKLLLDRVRQAGTTNSRIAGVIIISVFVVLTALFARAPVAQTRVKRPLHARSIYAPAPCTLSWTQLSPTGTEPDVNSEQFVSDDRGNLMMFGGCGPTGCNGSNNTFVLRDAFGVAGITSWVQLSTTGGPPGARHAHLLAYDSSLNELIVSGGCAGGCTPLANDMWSLSNANGLDRSTVSVLDEVAQPDPPPFWPPKIMST